MSHQDDMNKFKQVLATLPEDKRKLLYERLHDMPSSEREGFIKDFLKKYDEKASSENQKADSGKVPSQPTKTKPSPASSSKKGINEKHPANSKTSSSKPAPKEVGTKPVSKAAPKNVQKKPLSSADSHTFAGNRASVNDHASAKKKASVLSDKALVSKKAQSSKRTTVIKKKTAPVNPYTSVALGILIALVIIGTFYFIYLFNKPSVDAKFDSMFGLDPTESFDVSSEGTGSIMGPEPNFPTATPTVTPIPTTIPLKEDAPDLSGLVIVIDPGHQAKPNTELETIASNSSIEKEKATPGATGISTGAKEYEITLRYAAVMKEYLETCGATVILTRTDNDTDISNSERARVAVDNNADYFIRLHADSAPDTDIRGVKVYVPSSGAYTSSSESEGERLAETVADSIGSTSLGVVKGNMYTGLNYADSIESYQLVIGYISNSDDDALLSSDDTAYNTAVGVAEFLRQ